VALTQPPGKAVKVKSPDAPGLPGPGTAQLHGWRIAVANAAWLSLRMIGSDAPRAANQLKIRTPALARFGKAAYALVHGH
jgi:hypothetical protein